MSIVYVQSNKAYGTSSPISVAFPSNVGAGALIVVAIVRYGGGLLTSIADTRGNTYHQVGAELLYPYDNSSALDVWYAYNSGAGANTVSLAFNAAPNASVAIHEYSGALITDPLDKTHDNAPTGTGTNPVSSGATATTAQADELIFGVFAGYWGDTQTITADAGVGFTLRQTYGDGASYDPFGTEDRVVAATGTYAATFNRTNSQNGMARVVTFKAAAAAAGGLFLPGNMDGLSVGGPFFANPIG